MALLGALARDYLGRMRCDFDLPRLQQTAKASRRFQPAEKHRTKAKRGINPASKPSGTGCVECLASGGWWLQLRRCAECGLIGCCDSSPSQHAMKHAHSAGHPIVASFEPLQNWFYDYEKGKIVRGRKLLPPRSHPELQPVPGPPGKVPANWEELLNQS